jgi:hypothetical protein
MNIQKKKIKKKKMPSTNPLRCTLIAYFKVQFNGRLNLTNTESNSVSVLSLNQDINS